MSYFDLDTTESAQQLNNATLNPLNPDSVHAKWYEGIGTGLGGGFQSAYQRFALGNTPKSEVESRQARADKLFELTPDPKTVGMVGQIAGSMADQISLLGMSFMDNLVPTTAVMDATRMYQESQYEVNLRKGMDPKTATDVSRTEGAFFGAGAVLPGGMAGKVLTRAASGAGVNLVMGVGQRALISNTLTQAGYADMAKEYAPFEGAAVATDIAIGAFFGAALGKRPAKPGSKLNTGLDIELGPDAIPATPGQLSAFVDGRINELRTKRDGTPDTTMTGEDGQPMTIAGKAAELMTDDDKAELAFLEKHKDNPDVITRAYQIKLVDELLPSDLDAFLAHNNAAHVEVGTAPGIPTDPATRKAHVTAVNDAIVAMLHGEEVRVSHDVANGNFVPNEGANEVRTQIGSAINEHLGDGWDTLSTELEQRGLPGGREFYSISQRIPSEPVRVTAEVKRLAEMAAKEGMTPEQMLNGLNDLSQRLEVRNANRADANNGDRVRGHLWITERLTRAERLGELSPDEVAIAKWLIDQNPNIAEGLGISIREGKGDQVGGSYNSVERLATIMKGNGDPLTTAHEFLHHTERMMPEPVRKEIRLAWLAEVKRVRDAAEASGSLDLQLAINDVIKANLGDSAAYQRVIEMVKQGLVDHNFYQLVNPSEFWAVNASRLVRERAQEGWVRQAVQWVKEMLEKAKDVFGLKSDAAIIRGLDAVLNADGKLSGSMLDNNGFPSRDYANVEAPGKGVANENLNGFEPGLRVSVPIGKMKLPDKPLVLTGTNLKNAARQIAAIDTILDKFPDADKSPLEWSKMMAYAFATNDVPVPPYRFLNDINSDGAVKSLSRLSEGQIADATHGFENAKAFREAYTAKELDVETTGKLFAWSFLSRGVSPYTQEGLFIDAFTGLDQWVKKAAEGNLTEKDFPAYEAWASSVAPKGSGQPGSGATHNLNAFGKLFLFKMGQRDADGVSLLQKMHNMMEEPDMTGQQIRRWFIQNTEGVGIDNKVVSFTLLVAGFDDVMVLDRVQIRQLWDDGRFGDRNLYDGRKVDGKEVAGSKLADISYGARGLLIYEAVERALAKRIENIYTALGRPQDGSVGRYHWETWVADSQQEASHGTLDAILHDAKGNSEMIAEVTAKEGEYGAYAYGARYGRDKDGQPYFAYTTPSGADYRFDVPSFREFLQAVKSPANKVIPSGFKVTEAGNAPWYERAEVNKPAIDELAQRYAREPGASEGARAVQEAGTGQAVPDSTGRPDPYGPEALMASNPSLTYIQPDGTMVPAARALARADEEIATAQRESQGFDAAVACALRG